MGNDEDFEGGEEYREPADENSYEYEHSDSNPPTDYYDEYEYYDDVDNQGAFQYASEEGSADQEYWIEETNEDHTGNSAEYEELSAATGSARNLADAREILLRAKEARLGAGEKKHLAELLSDSLGLSQPILNAIERETKETIREYGYIGSPDAAGTAYCKIVDQYSPIENGLPGNFYCEEGFFTFNEDQNYYEMIPNEALSADVRRVFKGHAVVRTEREVQEILRRLADHYRETGFFMDAARGLPMANGFVCYDPSTEKVQLKPHSRNQKSRFCLDVDFSFDATAPVFLGGLERILPDAKKRQALQEVMGCLLLQVIPRQDSVRRMVILTGRGGSGKSTFIETAKLLLPPSVVANVPPASWKSEFARARLAGKWLNYCTELTGNRLLADDQVKQIVACETVTGRHRYGQEHEIRPMALHVLATNALPHIDDSSGAFDRRLLVLDFDRPLDQSEMDDNFLERIRKERAGIIAWAAEGAERLMRRGAFVLPPGHAEGMLKMKFKDDVIALFAHTQLEAAPGGRLASSELQAALISFAISRGYDRSAVTGSGAMRRLAGFMDAAFGAKRSASNNPPYYTGVALKGDAAPPAPDHGLAGL